jgi:hypothetical protein
MFISVVNYEPGSVERKVQEETVVKFFSLLQASRIHSFFVVIHKAIYLRRKIMEMSSLHN